MKIETFVFNPIMENTYLLIDEGSKECVIIDAGCYTDSEKTLLASKIEKEGLKLTRVLNTHLHLDHCFGNRYVAERFKVLPEASERDEFLLPIMKSHCHSFGIPLNEDYQKLGGYLSEADVIRFGKSELSVIEVPGHSPGGLAFYSKTDKVLFSGDSLFQGSIGRTDLDGGNFESLIHSLTKKIATLPPDTTVYPGHGGTTTIAYELDYNPYL